MQCSVGTFSHEECHKSVYGCVSEGLKFMSDYSEEEQALLKLRLSECDLSSVCKYHEVKYLVKYNHLFGNSCCNPLKIHKQPIKKGLREITLEYTEKQKNYSVNLTPGKSLCPNCYTKIFVIRENDDSSLTNDEFVPVQETLAEVDAVCSALDVSPMSKIMRLSLGKKPAALLNKTKKISDSLRRKLVTSFSENVPVLDAQDMVPASSLGEEYNLLIEKLKEKCTISSKEEQVKIISLLPRSWSKEKICREFKVSEHLVRVTRELVQKEGILPDLAKKRGHKISEEVVQAVTDFYEQDEISRICPGKKDSVSVRVGSVKEHKQKRLILCNLRELYVQFKNTHVEYKVGFSKFCALRPKWCVIAGASGTHSVCVCRYHQNVKLMLEGAKMNVDYKELLALMVCDVERYECMMGECADCLGDETLLELLSAETEDMPDHIVYKQWVNTDRVNMISVVQTYSEFMESLTEKLAALKKHHFVAKVQSQYLKEKKENLEESQCIVLTDFSENYSFLVQDEIQSFHWVNQQATIHPFVYYYKSESTVKCRSLCVISDHLEHNTATVHAFQKHLISDIKASAPSVNKVVYFSDGAASQYKNKKNFINICQHSKDFGLHAEWNFFASSHGKNACDGVGGTTKREAAKASLQRAYTDQIMSPNELYKYCSEKIPGISYVFVPVQEVQANELTLKKRFEKCKSLPHTREKHRVVPLDENNIRCYKTSKSTDFEEFSVTEMKSHDFLIFAKNDYIACFYDEQWWLGVIQEVNSENNDVLVKFFHPAGPRTSFKLSPSDTVWVPVSKILRKLTPLELTTATGRSYTISEKLCNEISHLMYLYNY